MIYWAVQDKIKVVCTFFSIARAYVYDTVRLLGVRRRPHKFLDVQNLVMSHKKSL